MVITLTNLLFNIRKIWYIPFIYKHHAEINASFYIIHTHNRHDSRVNLNRVNTFYKILNPNDYLYQSTSPCYFLVTSHLTDLKTILITTRENELRATQSAPNYLTIIYCQSFKVIFPFNTKI